MTLFVGRRATLCVLSLLALTSCGGGSGGGGGFIPLPTPEMTSVSPTSGPLTGGTLITVRGRGLDQVALVTTTKGASVLDAMTDLVVASDGLSFTCRTPSHTFAETVDITARLKNGNLIDLPNAFTYAGGSKPTVTSISPSSGPSSGGTSVTIKGTGFVGGTTVTIGGSTLGSLTIQSSTTITGTTPAGNAGPADVVVANVNGSSTLSGGFTYTSSSPPPPPPAPAQAWARVLPLPDVVFLDSIVIDPQNPANVYAAATTGNPAQANGAVYYTTTGGPDPASWITSTSGLGPSGVITKLFIRPQSPTVLYVGTADGVYKSVDSAQTWQQVLSGSVTQGDAIVADLDPGAGPNVYVGQKTSNAGVRKSTSFGSAPWILVVTGLGNLNVHALAMDPTDVQVLYAGTDVNVYKTIDGAASWTASTLPSGTVVNVLVVNATSTTTLYAGTQTDVWKTTNGGTSWVQRPTGSSDPRVTDLAIDPTNPSVVYAATVGGLFKSKDGGLTWKSLMPAFPALVGQVRSIAVDPVNSKNLYAGVFGISGTTGIYKSTTGGE